MITLSIPDLQKKDAIQAARRFRRVHYSEPSEVREDDETISEALSLVGGRLSYINRMVKQPDMIAQAACMVQREKGWLLSQIGLIPDHDDDVMDEVRYLLA